MRSSSSNFYQNYNTRVTSKEVAKVGEPMLKWSSLIQESHIKQRDSPAPPPLVLKKPSSQAEIIPNNYSKLGVTAGDQKKLESLARFSQKLQGSRKLFTEFPKTLNSTTPLLQNLDSIRATNKNREEKKETSTLPKLNITSMRRDITTKRQTYRASAGSSELKAREIKLKGQKKQSQDLSHTIPTPHLGTTPQIQTPTMPQIYKRIFNQTINTKFEKRRGSNESNTLPSLRGPELIKTLPTPKAQDTSIGVVGKKVGTKNNSVKKVQKQDLAVIHVIDDNGSQNRNKRSVQVFKCPKSMLLRHMTYFREQLDQKNKNGLESGIDVEISVHCQIKIFDWLMRYMYLANKILIPSQLHFENEILYESIQPSFGEQLSKLKQMLLTAPQESPKHQRISILEKLKLESTSKVQQDIPPLRVRNALSLALSSDHLGIPQLRNMCLQVMCQNLEEVVKLPIQMSSLGDNVLSSLARIVSAEALQALNDEKDRLTSLIYKYKVDQLLEENTFLRCGTCRKVYCNRNRDLLWCNSGKGDVLEHGQLITRHTDGPELKIEEFKQFVLQENFFTERELYWKLWGASLCVRCSQCDHYFPLTEYNMCFFHPQPLLFQESSDLVFMARHFGVYRCCLRRAFRFDPFLKHEGCARRDHQPDLTEPDDRKVSSIFKHQLWNLFIPHMSKIREYSSVTKSPLKRKSRLNSAMVDDEDNRDYLQQIMITPEPLGKKNSAAVRARLGSDSSDEAKEQNVEYEGMSIAFALLKYLGESKQYSSSRDVIIKNLQKQKKAASIKSPRVKKIHKTLATLNRNVLKMRGFAVERAALLQKLKKKLTTKRTRNLNMLDLQYGMSSTEERKMNDARDNRRRQDANDMELLSLKLREMRS